jgi:hypothetical protein
VNAIMRKWLNEWYPPSGKAEVKIERTELRDEL